MFDVKGKIMENAINVENAEFLAFWPGIFGSLTFLGVFEKSPLTKSGEF